MDFPVENPVLRGTVLPCAWLGVVQLVGRALAPVVLDCQGGLPDSVGPIQRRGLLVDGLLFSIYLNYALELVKCGVSSLSRFDCAQYPEHHIADWTISSNQYLSIFASPFRPGQVAAGAESGMPFYLAFVNQARESV